MRKLTRKWTRSLTEGEYERFSLPTQDHNTPEHQELVLSLEKALAQKSLLLKIVFAVVVSCCVLFLIYSIFQQALSP